MDIQDVVRELLSPAGCDDPFPLYSALHAHGPVAAVGPDAHPSVRALVHGHAAVNEVLRDPRFRNSDATRLDRLQPGWRDHDLLTTLTGSMMFANGPGHTRFRRLFQSVFTPRRVADLEPAIADLVDTVCDRMARNAADGATLDLMTEFAYRVPAGVVGRLFGIPERHWDQIPPRANLINDALSPRGHDPVVFSAANTAARELVGYYLDLIEQLRNEPDGGIISGILEQGAAGGHDVTDLELAHNLVVTYNAAFATTTPMIAHGLVQLLARPAHAARLRDDPATAPAYVEEILRFVSPVQFVSRAVAEDVEFHGVTVPAGYTALVLLGAANRDPARFADPDAFDPDRPDNHPISFGIGPHYCLGAALARSEGVLALPRLLRRFPDLAIGPDPVLDNSLLIPSYRSLPITLG
ncbi:cytochrome P450 [Longispora sp. NPDC051575]|uniref:cytochrome P450 n=1 Tax=Longispora sp. NPDC051575 TaxID=3154943 RepID=UPI003432ADCF